MDASGQTLGLYVSEEKHPNFEMSFEAKFEIHNNGGVPMTNSRKNKKKNTTKTGSNAFRTIMGVLSLLCLLNGHPWAKALNFNFSKNFEQ